MSSRPLLGGDSQSRKRRQFHPLSTLGNLASMGLFVSDSTAYDGICLMLNCEDDEERDELTKRWRDHKLEELNFVGTVGALLSTCLSSTSGWPEVLNDEVQKPWQVRSLWFSGLVFALFSVMIAGLQSMRLHRLSAHRDGLQMIREGLSRTKKGGRHAPYKFQVYAWEASQMFLVLSVALLVAGIAVLVWFSAGKTPGDWWDQNAKMAVTFTIVLGFAIVVLVASQSALIEFNKHGEDTGDSD